MSNLWSSNHPRNFWLCQPDLPDDVWLEAIIRALRPLHIGGPGLDLDSLLESTLGEGQFGAHRYKFGLARRLYYKLKPLLNQKITHWIRRVHSGRARKVSSLSWPIEPRYVQFQWEILRQVMLLTGKSQLDFRYFWPEKKKFAFVLTHDIETTDGQRAVPILADLEETLGFRSSFNFVPEKYPLDKGLMDDLRKRGFEIGVHGLKHDSKLFSSQASFERQATAINRYVREFQADGFRSPYTHRNPHWMQLLDIKYDLSFFDTDPYEPMPGGVMTIWPFTIGRFLELAYTLPQDSTVFNVLGESSPRIWLEKLAFIREYNGMALMLVHPDYSARGLAKECYAQVLKEIRARGECWHSVPHNVASWWKIRSTTSNSTHQQFLRAQVIIVDKDISIEIP